MHTPKTQATELEVWRESRQGPQNHGDATVSGDARARGYRDNGQTVYFST